MLRLTAVDGARAVLRMMTKDPWRTHATGLLTRESQIQQQLAGTTIPAPISLAVDPGGSAAGTPAHLMSWLTGSLDLVRTDDHLLDRLARLLTEIHRHDPGPARPREYQSWAAESKRVIPQWSQHPQVWKEAFAILRHEPPAHASAFLHRDFQLGNILWQDGEISGVVDWVETSWGPSGLDVAHCTTYLAMLHGTETAERFVESYRTLDGAALDDRNQSYWDVMDIVGYLPDPTKVAQPWREKGLDVTDQLARARLEEQLTLVVRRRSA
jgi:aminoglycoside phosphotransferase (APT) family kinase protein